MVHLGLLFAVLGIGNELRRKEGDVAQIGAAVRTLFDDTGDVIVGK